MKRKNIKIVGYITCVICMITMVVLLAVGAQADDKTIAYVENVTYSADNTAPETPEGYEGYLFAGWYVEGGENANAAGYSPVVEPIVGTAYCAKYVPTEVLGVKAQISEQIKNNTESVQNNTEDNVIRFVTSLDSTEYNHIGFNIKIAGTSYDQDAATTKNVYTTIYGIGADKGDVMDYSPTVFHKQSVYFKTYAFTTIPEAAFDSDITVTPYWITLDGTRVNGPEAVVRTVNYCRAWVYVDDSENAAANTAAPVGTSSNPYSDLQAALNVDGQTLTPRVILKSDYEYTGTTVAEATQSLTLASVKDEDGNVKKIIRNDNNSSRLLKVNVASETVNLEDITLDGNQKSGCVEIANGNLNMEAGSTITNGGNVDTGANVIVQASAELTMKEGSAISFGTAKKQGGNILTSGALTINGGVISDGKAIARTGSDNFGSGGNIQGYGASTITVNNGSILNGEASSAYYNKGALGGNICSTGDLYIKGGTISGGQAVSSYEVTGEETETFTRCRGGNFYCESGNDLVITGGTISDGTAEYGGNISATCYITVSDDANICGGAATYGGSIYTTRKLTVSGGSVSGGTATYGGSIYLHAAQISETEGSAANMTMSGGTISGGNAENGGNIYVARGIFTAEDNTVYHKLATLTMSGGTISGGNATIGGGNVYTAGKMTMTGGMISEGKALTDEPQYYQGIGGNICVTGVDAEHYATLTITGGIVKKGQVSGRGGNIDAHQFANLVLGTKSAETNDLAVVEEGSVSNTVGNANGGNIFARGSSKVTIYNGITIRGGSAGNQGGNILFDSPEAFVINGGSIQDGTAQEGGNCYFSEKCINVTLNAGTISGGTATNGGNIYLSAGTNSGAAMKMSGGLIDGGTAVKGGSIYIIREGQTTNEDGTYTSNPATLTMTGGTIQNGFATGTGANSARHGGGNIWCTGEFIMNGGTIQGGTTNYRGGNIFVERGTPAQSPYPFGGKITINAGSILNGASATSRGGNIMLDHALMELGGTGVINITGGKRNATLDENGKATTDENGVIAGKDSNVDMYGNTTPRQISIEGTMNLASKIGISVSSKETIDGKEMSNVGLFAIGATEYFNKYQRIFISDVANREISQSDNALSIGVATDSVGYYTAEDYLADESLFVPSWKGVWNPPAELLDFEKKWEAFFTPNGRLMCMAHRGDNDICYPENSIEGIMSCIQAGVDFLELDVRTTSDGIYVLMHDETITRTTNVNELRTAGVTGLPESNYISDWTLEELRQLRLVHETSSGKVVTNYVIPTLEEAISVCTNKIFVFLDNKAGLSWVNEIYPLVKKHEAYRSVWPLPGANIDKVPDVLATIEKDSGYKAAFQAAVTPDNVATVVAKIETNNLPKALRASDYDPTYDTAYASYFGKYRISTNALYGDYKNNLEEWIKLYQKGYNTLHVDDYMTLVQYIAEQL